MNVLSKIRSFGGECKRVLRVTKRPTKPELATTVKVSAIGIAIIGVIGFALHLATNLFRNTF